MSAKNGQSTRKEEVGRIGILDPDFGITTPLWIDLRPESLKNGAVAVFIFLEKPSGVPRCRKQICQESATSCMQMISRT